ncbi:hypothetical protein QJS10_CPB11g01115 [Acorus calamus]|uniref:Methyltransferase type 11 domain-containing protein n=1 Tax=Acorus calamus TaxID=4465 RepID=A0AAV9DRT7_ACOCL|nr:hypothetical protein QJS10_CPB11g01115 [Acorus calamus]
MERSIQTLLNRISLASVAVATATLLFSLSDTSITCDHRRNHPHQTLTLALTRFPRSSCESNGRILLSPDERLRCLRSTNTWRKKVDSSSAIFGLVRDLGFLTNQSKVLCVSAGAGHEVDALRGSGVRDVTGVEIFDSPPLVSRADPHNLPFFDGVFDVGYSSGLDEALFPTRFASEMERTVRIGGVCVVVVGRRSAEEELRVVKDLFRRSSFAAVWNVTLAGAEMVALLMRRNAVPA